MGLVWTTKGTLYYLTSEEIKPANKIIGFDMVKENSLKIPSTNFYYFFPKNFSIKIPKEKPKKLISLLLSLIFFGNNFSFFVLKKFLGNLLKFLL